MSSNEMWHNQWHKTFPTEYPRINFHTFLLSISHSIIFACALQQFVWSILWHCGVYPFTVNVLTFTTVNVLTFTVSENEFILQPDEICKNNGGINISLKPLSVVLFPQAISQGSDASMQSRLRFYCSQTSGKVTVQDSESGKSFSSILNLTINVQKSPINCLKEQNIHRKQSVYVYLIVNNELKDHDRFW